MEYGTIVGVKKPVARLIQGTTMLSMTRQEAYFALLDGIFALGGSTFDTAHGYGAGDSERTLGAWVAARGIREQVVIITKGAHPYDGRKRVTPADITADLHESLERLQTDTIDLYLLHRDDPAVPVEPIVDILNEHLQAGKIHAFGGSNWSHERLQAANDYAAQNGLVPFAVSSPHFSLAEQQVEPWEGCITIAGTAQQAARAWYSAHPMPLLTWSSLAGGFFSGRFKRDNLDSFTEYFDKICAMTYGNEANFQRLDRAQTLAQAKHLTAAQIALAYVMSQPFDIYALTGCHTPAEFAENAAVLARRLTPDELHYLNQ